MARNRVLAHAGKSWSLKRLRQQELANANQRLSHALLAQLLVVATRCAWRDRSGGAQGHWPGGTLAGQYMVNGLPSAMRRR